MVRESLTLRCFSAILLQVGHNKSIQINDLSNTRRIIQGVGCTERTSDCFALSSCVRSQPSREGGDGLCFFQIPTRSPAWVHANAEQPAHSEIGVSHIA